MYRIEADTFTLDLSPEIHEENDGTADNKINREIPEICKSEDSCEKADQDDLRLPPGYLPAEIS